MTYSTVEVELENGRVRPCGTGSLPAKAHALLTVLDVGGAAPAQTCEELAKKWSLMEKLPADEGKTFADDIEQSRKGLPGLKDGWE